MGSRGAIRVARVIMLRARHQPDKRLFQLCVFLGPAMRAFGDLGLGQGGEGGRVGTREMEHRAEAGDLANGRVIAQAGLQRGDPCALNPPCRQPDPRGDLAGGAVDQFFCHRRYRR